ncbi:MAG: homoserine O-succinyltransferase [Bacteroidales bacterium]|nr:homoserine O-succinyltransferase [Bacteroidales bacterium]MBR4272662.1 homoserine O-succinyltransferase [Bacteroidales bacterium]MBR4326923.1 homoserine O-succinyltransferase [Bacteroidales bacterium]
MPLTIPDKLPAIELLKKENIFVIDNSRANAQDIRPLKIAILNLMPIKETTETDLLRLLSNSPLQINIDFIKLRSHTSKNTPIEHMQQFYMYFDVIKQRKYDGLIVTGAPVEQYEYEDVTYWNELTEVFDWARTNVTAKMFICWGACAALYHYYGIPKHDTDEKIFGVFKHNVLEPLNPIFRGFDDVFYVPHSRHTEILPKDIDQVPEIKILASSNDAGLYMMMAKEGRELYLLGHAEYNARTLDTEYRRDLQKGLHIDIPKNYYPYDDPDLDPLVRWRSTANLMFSNWLNYFVYQETPYNIDDIK